MAYLLVPDKKQTRKVPLKKTTFFVGRARENDLTLASDSLSRFHAQINSERQFILNPGSRFAERRLSERHSHCRGDAVKRRGHHRLWRHPRSFQPRRNGCFAHTSHLRRSSISVFLSAGWWIRNGLSRKRNNGTSISSTNSARDCCSSFLPAISARWRWRSSRKCGVPIASA